MVFAHYPSDMIVRYIKLYDFTTAKQANQPNEQRPWIGTSHGRHACVFQALGGRKFTIRFGELK